MLDVDTYKCYTTLCYWEGGKGAVKVIYLCWDVEMLIIVGKIYVSHLENSYLPPPTTRPLLGDTVNTNGKTKSGNRVSQEASMPARRLVWISKYDNMKYLHTGADTLTDRRCWAVTELMLWLMSFDCQSHTTITATFREYQFLAQLSCELRKYCLVRSSVTSAGGRCEAVAGGEQSKYDHKWSVPL